MISKLQQRLTLRSSARNNNNNNNNNKTCSISISSCPNRNTRETATTCTSSPSLSSSTHSSSFLMGAIIGDIAGSRYERVARSKKGAKDDWTFDLITDRCWFTDDTVLTIAVADALLQRYDHRRASSKTVTNPTRTDHYEDCIRKWAIKYPKAGYGSNFSNWVVKGTGPYYSWGNGSAMRVSPVGYLPTTIATTLEHVLEESKESAACTHNHPEGIKGAQAIAACIYMARKGQSKEEIKSYIETNFDGYDLHRSIKDIRPTYRFDVSCQGSVPESIIAFLEGENYADVLRHAINLGGDADTQAAIAGSIAHAYYNTNTNTNDLNNNNNNNNHNTFNLESRAKKMLPEEMIDIIDRFDIFVHQHQQNNNNNNNNNDAVVDTCC